MRSKVIFTTGYGKTHQYLFNVYSKMHSDHIGEKKQSKLKLLTVTIIPSQHSKITSHDSVLCVIYIYI